MLPVLLVAALSASATGQGPARAAPRSSEIVSRVLDAYGGRAALERARVLRQEGTVTSRMRGETGQLLRVFERPGRLRVEIRYPRSGPEVRVVQGTWGRRDGREVSGSPMHAAMVLQAARLALPLSLAAADVHLTDRGTIDVEGGRVRVLVQSLPDGMELEIHVDPATARIVRSVGRFAVPGVGPIEFATAYSVFRSFGGLLFATHEESWARGQHTGSTDIARVEVLREAPPEAFEEAL